MLTHNIPTLADDQFCLLLLPKHSTLHNHPFRPSRAPGVSCAATVQLTAPKTVSAPRQMPAKSVALEPTVAQEATIHYGKPLRGSPTPLGATYIKEAVSVVVLREQGSQGAIEQHIVGGLRAGVYEWAMGPVQGPRVHCSCSCFWTCVCVPPQMCAYPCFAITCSMLNAVCLLLCCNRVPSTLPFSQAGPRASAWCCSQRQIWQQANPRMKSHWIQ